jgi:hypothetical protein
MKERRKTRKRWRRRKRRRRRNWGLSQLLRLLGLRLLLRLRDLLSRERVCLLVHNLSWMKEGITGFAVDDGSVLVEALHVAR